MLPSLFSSNKNNDKKKDRKLEIARQLALNILGDSSKSKEKVILQPIANNSSVHNGNMPSNISTKGGDLVPLKDVAYLSTSMKEDEQLDTIKTHIESLNSVNMLVFDRSKPSTGTNAIIDPDLISKRMKRTLKLMSHSHFVYNMKFEKELITKKNLELFIEETNEISKRDKISLSVLIDTFKDRIKFALFGCEVDIGICTDANATEIEFFGNDYKRKIRKRDEASAFLCIEKNDVVLESISSARFTSPIRDMFSRSDSVVYVPLMGSSNPQGVCEIYGFQSDGITDSNIFERSDKALRAMIEAKDYKFKSNVRLWKKPPIIKKQQILENKSSRYHRVSCFLVAGYVTEICHTKKGIPYFGGPRFKITWENGEVDPEVAAKDLLDIYRQTPRSLGCSSVLDDDISIKLLEIGKLMGKLIETQRIKTFLMKLRKSINSPTLKYQGIAEIGLQSITSMLNGCREVALMGFNSSSRYSKHLVGYFPKKNNKIGEVFEFDYSMEDITIKTIKNLNSTTEINVQADKSYTNWISLELKLRKEFYWHSPKDFDRFIVVIHRDIINNAKLLEIEITTIKNVLVEIVSSVELIWEKLVRKRNRMELLKQLEIKLFEWGSSLKSRDYLSNKVLDYIKNELSGANFYIGLLDSGSQTMEFVATSYRSKMLGVKLKRGEGVSFDVIDSLKTLVLTPDDMDKTRFLKEGSLIDIKYGGSFYRGKLGKNRGHEMFDVIYDFDHKSEAGVHINRIVPVISSFKVKQFGKMEFPFVCIPIRHKNKPMGVLGLDTIKNIPKSPNESSPDTDLLYFLEHLTKQLGTYMDLEMKKKSIKIINSISKNDNAIVYDVMEATNNIFYSIIYSIRGVSAFRYIYETFEPVNTHGFSHIHSKGEIGLEAKSKLKAFNINKVNSHKYLFFVGDNTIFMFLKMSSGSKEKEPKVYAFVMSLRSPITEPDQEYLESIQKIISSTIHNTVTKKVGSDLRRDALNDIQTICSDLNSYPTIKSLFDRFMESVHLCFVNAHVYVGLLGSLNKEINYFLASYNSDMCGKKLIRNQGDFPSFNSLDNLSTIAISNRTDPLVRKMFHFGNKQNFEYPFIAIPLVADIDSIIGVLGIDGCGEPGEETSNINDLVNFFQEAGYSLSKVITEYKIKQLFQKLVYIANNSKSYAEGMLAVKQVILELLPYALRVLEIVFEPREVPLSLLEKSSFHNIDNTADNYYICFVRVLDIFAIGKEEKFNVIECVYHNEVMFRSAIDKIYGNPPFHLMIPLTANLNNSDAFLRISLLNSLGNEVGSKSIPINYFLHVPTISVTHSIFNRSIKEAKIADVNIVSKLFLNSDVVVVNVESIKLIDFMKQLISSNNQSLLGKIKSQKCYFVLKWNDIEILKSSELIMSESNEWLSLNVDLKYDSNIDDEYLVIELWSKDKSGKCLILGQIKEKCSTFVTTMSSNNIQSEIFPSENAIESSINFVIGSKFIINGNLIRAVSMNDKHIEDELTLKSSKIEQLASSVDVVAQEKKFVSCELGILAAHNLYYNKEWGGQTNSYVLVCFNGIELSKSSIVYNTCNPVWDEELFIIKLPQETNDFENCSLVLEIYHVFDDSNQKDFLIGVVELNASMISKLLSGKKYRSFWFDITKQKNEENVSIYDDFIAKGEIKLSGRPLSVKADIKKDISRIDKPIKIEIVSISDLSIAVDRAEDLSLIFMYCQIYFNDQLIYETTRVNQYPTCNFKDDSLIINEPNDLEFVNCILRIDIFQSSINWRNDIMVGSTTISRDDLSNLLGGKNMISKPFDISVEKSVDILERVKIPSIKLKCGPDGAPHVYEDSDVELCLDILSISSLNNLSSNRSIITSRPHPICLLFWNNKLIGKTKALSLTSSNPLWSQERFYFNIPNISKSLSDINMSKLTIEIYDDSINGNVLLGSINFKDKQLETMFNSEIACSNWFKVDSKLELNSFEADENICEIKLRTGFLEAEVEKSNWIEYRLDVVSAKGLSNIDSFGGVDAFVVILWMNKEVGRTEIVIDSNNPIFENELFYLKYPLNTNILDMELQFQVWSRRKGSANIFLGQSTLSDMQLFSFLKNNNISEFELCPSVEMTEKENSLVAGHLSVKCSKNEVFPFSEELRHNYFLHIEGATSLLNNNTDGFLPEVHCRVYRKSLFEKDEDTEIYRTAKVKSIDPVFSNEYAILTVNDLECTGLSIRFELWDYTNELLGSIVFEKENLLSLISSSNSGVGGQQYELIVPQNYDSIVSKISLKCLTEEAYEEMKNKNVPVNNFDESSNEDEEEEQEELADDVSLDSQVNSITSSQVEEQAPLATLDTSSMNIEITIKSLKDFIMKSTKFGRGGSGIYACLYWSDFKQPVGKTKIVNSMTDLTFDKESFVVQKKEGEELANYKLKISIFSKSTFSSDSCIAETVIIKEELVKFINSRDDFAFNLVTASEKDQPVQGSVLLSAKILLNIDNLPIFNKRLIIPQSLKEVEIDIIRLTGIERFTGLYCSVKWGPVEIGKTSTIKDQSCPIITWDENQSLTIRVPKTSIFDIPNLYESDLTLVVEIYDVLNANKNNLIGSVTIPFMKIHENLEKSRYHRAWYQTDNNAECRVYVLMTEKVEKIIQSKEKLKDSTNKQRSQQLQIYVPMARDLKQNIKIANTRISMSSIRPNIISKNDEVNAYIRCRWNGKFVGKSLIVKNNISPSWEDEFFTVSAGSSSDILNSELYLEFWNSKSDNNDVFLGALQIKGVDLQNFIENSSNEERWFSLEQSDYFDDSMQEEVFGEAKVVIVTSDNDSDEFDNLSSSVEIIIHSAKDLFLQNGEKNKAKQSSIMNAIGSIGSNLFGGSVSAFAVLKWGSKEIGRTKVISKSSSPYWGESFVVNTDKYMDQSELTINIWNDRGNVKGELLGRSKVSKSTFINGDSMPRTFFNLDSSQSSDGGVSGMVEIEIKSLTSSSHSLMDFTQINWINILDSDAGYPIIKFDILSINNLPLGDYLPTCKVKFGTDEIGNTSRCSYDQSGAISGRGQWEEESFYISLSFIFDKHNKRKNDILNISVWDKDIDKEKCYLGDIEISFNELLRLYDGDYSYPLQSRYNKKKDIIIGELQFRIAFIFPFWDSHRLEKASSIKRTIRVNGALNLPAVNDLAPNCKCAIQIDEIIRIRTSIVSNDSFPKWSQCQVDLLLDLKKAPDIIILVYHVDSKSRKEITIGQISVPFDYLLRPPEKEFEIFLNAPLGQRNSNYTFTVSGSLSLQIFTSQNADDSSTPYSSRSRIPVRPLLVESTITKLSSKKKAVDVDIADDGLTLEDKLWLGTNYNYWGPGVITGMRRFIVLPISDMGIQIGAKKTGMIGSKPGSKIAFCIERPDDKHCISDVTLLEKLSSEISNTLITLRRKDLTRALRAEIIRGVNNFVDYYRSFQSKGVKFSDFVHHFIRDAMMNSFPGSVVTVGFVTTDNLSIKYSRFKESDSESKLYTLFKDQGNDWEYIIGKALNIKSFTYSNVIDLAGTSIAIFGNMVNQMLPRITVPLRADDANLGIIHLDNFVTHRESRRNEIIGETELKKWLEDFGGICGEYIYSERESIFVAKVKQYLMNWDSSLIGMIRVAMENCFEVLQGCRIMEVMQIDRNNHLKSLSQAKPISISIEEGHDVTIEGIKLTHTPAKSVIVSSTLASIGLSLFSNRKKGKTSKTGKSQLNESSEETSSGYESKAVERIKNKIAQISKKKVQIMEEIESNDVIEGVPVPVNTEENNLIIDSNNNNDDDDLDSHIEVAANLILGISYDGVEYCQVLQFSKYSNSISMNKVSLKITVEKDIRISLYEVDENLNIVSFFYDDFTFSTFKESEISINLHMPLSKVSYLHSNLYLSWGRTEDVKVINSIEPTQKSEIKGYNIIIMKASNLKINEKASHEGVDTFCEVYYNDKYIDKTSVKKKSRYPEWEEKFFIPQGKKRSAKIIIEVYEMNFLRKGAFLGKIELTKDQILNPPDGPTDFELKMKDTIDPKKQSKVGGLLKLSYNVEYFQNEEVISKSSELPTDLWSMDRPSLKLIINSASGLAKANRFGGSSDPFVMVFVGNETEEPVFKTKVIDDCLDPKWEESVSINLGIKPEKNTTTINNFPIIRFEVYDYNTLGEMPFLGGCEITPSQYLYIKSGDFQLKTLPSKKDSKLIQGTINLMFTMEDSFSSSDTFAPMFSPQRTLSCNTILEIEIIKAKNLMVTNRIGGKSDPYVVIKWNDKVWGETTYKKGNLNPHWTNEFFQVNLSSNGYEVGSLTLELYDKDFFTTGQFMGEVKLDCDYLLHPPSGPQEVDLKPKPPSNNSDPNIDKKIQGSLTFQMSIIYKKQKLNIPQIKSVKVREQNESSPPMSVLLAHDPVLEANRQKSEKTNLPSVISTSSVKMQNYLNRPFERTGLISELHYGQLLASSRRGDHTILKADTVDMICIPTTTKEYNLMNKGEYIHYMIGRYGPGKIPKRDIKALMKIKDIFTEGSQYFSDRAKRLLTYHNLETSLRNITTLKDHFDQMIIQMLLEIQVAINITNIKIYLLNQNGSSFNELLIRDEIVEVDKINNTFIQNAAKLCRLDYAIQIARNRCSLVDMEWLHVTQANLPSLDSARERIDDIEGPNWTSDFMKESLDICPNGGFIVPLIFQKEILIGMFLIKGIDSLPQSLYSREAAAVTNKMSSNNTKSIDFLAPEDGLVNCVRSAAIIIAESILASRVSNICRKLKTFPIRRDTTALSIIQNIFNQIALCIPVIRSISIWAVDITQEVIMQQTTTTTTVVIPKVDVPKSVMGKFMSSMKILQSDKPGTADKAVSVKRINNINQSVDIIGNKLPDPQKPGILSGYFGIENFGENGYQIEKWTLGFPDSFKDIQSDITLEDNDVSESKNNNDSTKIKKLNIRNLNTVHAEVVRCYNTFKQDSFQVMTGHSLVPIGTTDSSRIILRNLFPNDKIDQIMSTEGFVTKTAKPVEPAVKRSPRMKSAPLPKESHSKYCFYIAANSYGTGGNEGWGSVCEKSRVHITNMAKILDLNLTKLSDERDKSNTSN